MERDLKVPTTFTLDPVVNAWIRQTAAQQTLETKRYVSASEIANLILKAAMEIEGGNEDTQHLRKLIRKYVLRYSK